MIKRSEEKDRGRVLGILCLDEGMNTPVLSYIERYGFEKRFQDIWLCQEEDTTTAVMLRHFNHSYLYISDERPDYEEMASFCSFMDTDFVWGGHGHLEQIQHYIPGYELEPSKHMILLHPENLVSEDGVEVAAYDDSDQLAALIYQDEDFRRFYHSEQEIQKGIRRRMEMGQCLYMTAQIDGLIASSAYTSLESTHYVTIGGVVTRPEYRGRGLASRVVSALCRRLLEGGKTPNLFFRHEAAGSLYRRLGFVEAGDYGMLGRNAP